jgi:hypothetical protein
MSLRSVESVAISRHLRSRITHVAHAALLAGAVLSVPAGAQTPPPPSALTVPAGTQTPPPASAPVYSAEQLDQMLAPIALYPDDLLGQILMASTYPLEVVQADRWLQNSSNAALRGNDLTQALQSQPWDASVKSLVASPQILSWMDNGLDWTEAVGEAFLAQQADVMDSVQRLRARAQAAGSLSSTPQQTVTSGDQGIEIASGNPSVEYVPVYSPQYAYGDWPYPDYPPDEFYAPGYEVGTFIAFPIVVGFWGWDRWDWRHHRIDVDRDGGPGSHDGGRRSRHPVPWHHDPAHRGGVPYTNPVTRAKYQGPTDPHAARGNFRGYPPTPNGRPPAVAMAPNQAPGPVARAPIAGRPAPAPQARAPVAERAPARAPVIERPMPAPGAPRPVPAPMAQAAPRPPPAERAAPLVMESFGRGEQVHVQEQRGMASRAAPVAAAGGGGARGHR